MENLEGGKKDQNFLKINNKVKKIKNLVLFIFICLSLFFMGRFFYVMYDEKVNLDNEIENSLSLAEKKLDMYLKTFKWEEIDEKKINYNTIFQNYLMYKPKTNINQNYTIYKLPYVREKFSSIINNGIIISKENERNNKKLERILSKELSTLNEIEKILENENLKNTRIVAVNNDYRMIFSKEVLDELKEKYYSESLKYPIISGKNMRFYKKKNGKIYYLEIKNYNLFLKTLLKTPEFKRYEYLFLISPSTRYIYIILKRNF